MAEFYGSSSKSDRLVARALPLQMEMIDIRAMKQTLGWIAHLRVLIQAANEAIMVSRRHNPLRLRDDPAGEKDA